MSGELKDIMFIILLVVFALTFIGTIFLFANSKTMEKRMGKQIKSAKKTLEENEGGS